MEEKQLLLLKYRCSFMKSCFYEENFSVKIAIDFQLPMSILLSFIFIHLENCHRKAYFNISDKSENGITSV